MGNMLFQLLEYLRVEFMDISRSQNPGSALGEPQRATLWSLTDWTLSAGWDLQDTHLGS